jgi:hypothetical protein
MLFSFALPRQSYWRGFFLVRSLLVVAIVPVHFLYERRKYIPPNAKSDSN